MFIIFVIKINRKTILFGIYEIIGYVASFIAAASLSMKNIVKLRWLNLFGAVIFSVYGLLIEAYPVFLLNIYITIIDIYYIIRMYSNKDSFSLVNVSLSDSSYLDEFIKTYEEDILKFFPDFRKEDLKKYNCYFVLRNLNPAGLFVCETLEDNKIKIHVDYAISEYRDLKNAMYLYSTELKLLKNNKSHSLIVESNVKEHQKYLTNVGFKRENNSDVFIKNI